MSASESLVFSSTQTGPLTAKGGRYLFSVNATFNGGFVALQGLLPDGSTYAAVPDIAGASISQTAAGWRTVDLAPGQYRINTTTATAIAAILASVPT